MSDGRVVANERTTTTQPLDQLNRLEVTDNPRFWPLDRHCLLSQSAPKGGNLKDKKIIHDEEWITMLIRPSFSAPFLFAKKHFKRTVKLKCHDF